MTCNAGGIALTELSGWFTGASCGGQDDNYFMDCPGNPQRIAGRVAGGGLIYRLGQPGQLEIA